MALPRHEAENAVVIPIFLRAADLTDEPFMGLQGPTKEAVQSPNGRMRTCLGVKSLGDSVRSSMTSLSEKGGDISPLN